MFACAALLPPSLLRLQKLQRSSAPSDVVRLFGVLALGEFLDDLRAEGRHVLRAPAGDEALVRDDLLVDSGTARVADVRLECRERCESSAFYHVGLDEQPGYGASGLASYWNRLAWKNKALSLLIVLVYRPIPPSAACQTGTTKQVVVDLWLSPASGELG